MKLVERRSPILVEVRGAGPLRIWDHPRDGGNYTIGVDFAEHKQRDVTSQRTSASLYGRDQRDFNSATVWDVDLMLHVASLHGIRSAVEWTESIVALGYYYNTALLVPELNNPGAAATADLLEVYRYPRIYRMQFRTRVDEQVGTQYGYRSDGPTRQMLMNHVERILGMAHQWTRDAETIDELKSMQRDKRGEPRGMEGDKDDRVFSLALALEGAHRFHDKEPEEASVDPVGDARIWEQAKRQVQDHERQRTAAARRSHRARRRGRRF